MTKPDESPGMDIPRGIGAPATRALTAAGYASLEQLAGVPEAELPARHGLGPKAVTVLREVMAERGLALG
ncbi:DNA-binding protein [Streptomyces sp. NPDC002992]|uniref:DNA-binding protein n=1 Tax=Streptomyces sp. NPDC002992 TaxID=3154273 RepID=UPI0033AC804A